MPVYPPPVGAIMAARRRQEEHYLTEAKKYFQIHIKAESLDELCRLLVKNMQWSCRYNDFSINMTDIFASNGYVYFQISYIRYDGRSTNPFQARIPYVTKPAKLGGIFSSPKPIRYKIYEDYLKWTQGQPQYQVQEQGHHQPHQHTVNYDSMTDSNSESY